MPQTFTEILDGIYQVHRAYGGREIDLKLSPREGMLDRNDPSGFANYMRAGRNAVENTFCAMAVCSKPTLVSILDMPSGFGRVTRHLAAAFPAAKLYACDLYQDRIEFCAQQFGSIPIKSKEHFDEIDFSTRFDLIWCGSLLTHLPEDEFAAALGLFSRSLNPDGIALFTTHGRHSPFVQHNRWKYLPDERFATAEGNFHKVGFGYADYNAPDAYTEQKAYGISLSSPAFIANLLAKDESIRIRSFLERGWDGHQDVVVFQKLPING